MIMFVDLILVDVLNHFVWEIDLLVSLKKNPVKYFRISIMLHRQQSQVNKYINFDFIFQFSHTHKYKYDSQPLLYTPGGRNSGLSYSISIDILYVDRDTVCRLTFVPNCTPYEPAHEDMVLIT